MNNGNGNYAGTSYRYNNVTIDGASFNNSFGLSSALGANGTEAISLEALEQIQVMIAPYDVRNGAFTGAAINSVTKSGTNDIHASAYMYVKSPDLMGYRQKDDINQVSEFSNKQYGISISGPIIKNKLFYYINSELDRQEVPVNFIPRADTNQTVSGQYSRADEQRLQEIAKFLSDNFDGYNPGSYNIKNVPTKADRFTARLDWNIDDKNALSLKYFYLKSFNTNFPSSSGAPAGGRGPNEFAIPFSSTYYRTNNNFNIVIADWSLIINDKMSNTLKAGFSGIRDYRDMDGGFFPQVDILENDRTFTTFGTEANSYNNMLNSDIWQIQDNFLITLDEHQITIGTQSDLRKFKNGYCNSFAGQWRYESFDKFKEDVFNYNTWVEAGSPSPRPQTTALSTGWAQAYSKKGEFPYAYVDVLTLGFYVQDKWTVMPNLNITLGLRMDMPIFLTDLEKNPEVEELIFQGDNKIDVSKYPGAKPMFSPRLGFNWDAMNNKVLQVRGGTGLFTGTPPYVWISNQAGNNGMLFGLLSYGRPFDGQALYQPDPSEVASSKMSLAITDPDFKYPQLWKSNIAADYKFGDGWIATIEVLYGKDVNAIYHTNIGLNNPGAYVNEGGGLNKRPYYNITNIRDGQYITNKTTDVVMMKNTNKGYSLYTTLQLQKNFNDGLLEGLYLNGSFTFGRAKGVNDGSSSQAVSAWRYRPAIDVNSDEIGFSAGSFNARVLLQASYTANWGKHGSSSFGLVYQTYQPFRYSYTYNGDVNGDGRGENDLIYIPKNIDDIRIVSNDGRSVNEIWSQIDAFINQDPYLKNHRGEYAERNGAVTPFAHQLDANISHDIKFYTGKHTHTIRFSFDIFNFLNLLNKDWGIQPTTMLGYYNSPQYQFLQMTDKPSAENHYTPAFTMVLDANKNVISKTFKDLNDKISRWQVQFGIKYFF
jgi:hypothetical protein